MSTNPYEDYLAKEYTKKVPPKRVSSQSPVIPVTNGTRLASSMPDSIEPISVYRHWSLNRVQGLLLPPIHNKGLVWTGSENVAVCDRHPGKNGLPGPACVTPSCGCGFYGVYDPLHEYAKDTSLGGGVIFGVMAAYGRVSLGDYGLRAEKARIVALHVPYQPRFSALRGTLNRLMSNYPDARFYRDRDNLIAAEGVERPNDLMRAGFRTGGNFG